MQNLPRTFLTGSQSDKVSLKAVKNAVSKRGGNLTENGSELRVIKRDRIAPPSEFESKLHAITEGLFSKQLSNEGIEIEGNNMLSSIFVDELPLELEEENLLSDNADEILDIFSNMNKLEQSELFVQSKSSEDNYSKGLGILNDKLADIISRIDNSEQNNNINSVSSVVHDSQNSDKSISLETVLSVMDDAIVQQLKSTNKIKLESDTSTAKVEMSDLFEKMTAAADGNKVNLKITKDVDREINPEEELKDLKTLLGELKPSIRKENNNSNDTNNLLGKDSKDNIFLKAVMGGEKSEINDIKLISDLAKLSKAESAESTKSSASNQNTTGTFLDVKVEEFPRLTSRLAQNARTQGSTTARMVLNPKSLGTVFVDVNLAGNQLSINIKTETKEAASKIEQQLGILKERLSALGIQTENVNVKMNEDSEKQASSYQDPNNNREKREQETERRSFLKTFADLQKDLEKVEDK